MSCERRDPVWTPGQVLETPVGRLTLEKQLGAGKSGYSHLSSLDGKPIVAKRMHDEPVPYYEFHDDKCALEYRAYVRLKRIGVPVPTMLHLNPEKEYLLKEYIPGPDGLHAIRDGLIDDEVIRELLLLSDLCRREDINLDWFPANFIVLPASQQSGTVPKTLKFKRDCPDDCTDEKPDSENSDHTDCHSERSEESLGMSSNVVDHAKESTDFGLVGAGPRITKRLAYIDYELNEYSEEWSFEEWGIWYWANRGGVTSFLETGDASALNNPPDSGKPVKSSPDLVQRWLADK